MDIFGIVTEYETLCSARALFTFYLNFSLAMRHVLRVLPNSFGTPQSISFSELHNFVGLIDVLYRTFG